MIEVLQLALSWVAGQLTQKPKTSATILVAAFAVIIAGTIALSILSTHHTLTKNQLKKYKDTVRKLRVSLEGKDKVLSAYRQSADRYEALLKLRKQQADLSCKADAQREKRKKLEERISKNKEILNKERDKVKDLSTKIDKAGNIDQLLKIAKSLEK